MSYDFCLSVWWRDMNEVLTAVLLRIQVFWFVTLFHWLSGFLHHPLKDTTSHPCKPEMLLIFLAFIFLSNILLFVVFMF
jgi:hypothetical protein